MAGRFIVSETASSGVAKSSTTENSQSYSTTYKSHTVHQITPSMESYAFDFDLLSLVDSSILKVSPAPDAALLKPRPNPLFGSRTPYAHSSNASLIGEQVNYYFKSAGVKACTTLVPSLNLVRKMRFAF